MRMPTALAKAMTTTLIQNSISGGKNGTTITTQGDILYRDGSGLQRLAKGTANQTLQMNGGATAPSWVTVAPATSDFVRIANLRKAI